MDSDEKYLTSSQEDAQYKALQGKAECPGCYDWVLQEDRLYFPDGSWVCNWCKERLLKNGTIVKCETCEEYFEPNYKSPNPLIHPKCVEPSKEE